MNGRTCIENKVYKLIVKVIVYYISALIYYYYLCLG